MEMEMEGGFEMPYKALDLSAPGDSTFASAPAPAEFTMASACQVKGCKSGCKALLPILHSRHPGSCGSCSRRSHNSRHIPKRFLKVGWLPP